MVHNGKPITPPGTDNIPEGIRRASVMDLASNEMSLKVVERSIGRSELYISDEVFLTGAAVEIAPIVQIDYRHAGPPRRAFEPSSQCAPPADFPAITIYDLQRYNCTNVEYRLEAGRV